MKFEKVIILHIYNWPRFQRSTTFTLDAQLFPSEQSIRDYVHGRFGEGSLRQSSEGEWLFERRIAGPGFFWRMLSLLLNKSYV